MRKCALTIYYVSGRKEVTWYPSPSARDKAARQFEKLETVLKTEKA